MKLRTLSELYRLMACGTFIAIVAVSCATAPETGRRQLILMSASEELQLGFTSFEKMKKEMPISKDAKVAEMVQRVGKRIAGVASLPNAQWEFVVFESKEANAFCLPGGKVGVYTGLLTYTKTEAGLATVIGHEVAHAVARHGAERMTQSLLLQTAGGAVQQGFSHSSDTAQKAAATVYGLGANLGLELPHSRKQESEADEIGLMYMARAGYDPEEAVKFWERFSQAGLGGQTPWFLRTHPSDAQRIQRLTALLPKAKAEYHPAPR